MVLSGICAYATALHLTVALRRPFDRAHLLFAGLCLATAAFGLANAWTYQAESVAGVATALRWNIALAAPIYGLLLWFTALYSGVRPRRFLAGMSLLIGALFVVNLFQPYSLQFEEIHGIERLRLPWGEELTLPLGRNGPWFFIAISAVLIVLGYLLYALVRHWRRQRQGTAFAMLLAATIWFGAVVEGILVRAGVIDFLHLGPFGFLIMVIVMSVACSRETRQRMEDSERRFRSLVEQSPFSIQVLAPDGSTRQVNPAWEELWGLKAEGLVNYNILEDRQLVDKGIMPYIKEGFAGGPPREIPPIVYNPADNPVVKGPFREAANAPSVARGPRLGPIRDRWVRAHIYPLKGEDGAIQDVILVHEDITEKKRVEDAIRLIAAGVSAETGERFFQKLVQSLAALFDADYAFIGLLDERDAQRVNTLAVCAHDAIAPNLSYALAGTPCANVMGQSTCAYPRGVQRLFPQDRLLAEMGVEGYIGTPLFDARGQPLGIIVVLDGKPLEHIEQFQDILEIFAARAGAEMQRERAEAHIRRMAYYDYLTGLASRAHLHERLSEVLRAARLAGDVGALLLIDLDHFKTINDALSHDVGDEVLRAVARRLTEVVAGRALVARFGGDEFVVLMRTGAADTKAAEQAAREMAQQLLEKLLSPLFVGDRAFTLGASIGIVLFPENGETELDIVRHADMALYRAKQLGRGNIQFFSPGMQDAATSRLQLEDGLRRAVGNGELELYFQPQLDAAGRTIGAEALLRWHHPELGDVPPATFIPIAEETGLIHAIGRWVFDQACERFTAWRRAGAPFAGCLSINMAPWQFARPDFVEQVRYTLKKYSIDPGSLMLELTETALLYDLEEAVEKLAALRALGLKVALDDFGTGYSSLAYLRDLPLDQIKIDRAFVSELGGAVEHPLVESMIAIGQHMKLTVVAEGVETEAQRNALVKLGCESFQGYLFCRPIPEKDFLRWLDDHR
jgi:diguanylate cyclase (GGDEF)-like protein